jgi:hypothetical protein
LLETASEAYRTVIGNYGDQRYAAIAARFGLAAIAENRGDFDAAKQQYDQIALDTKDMPAYQQMASRRLNMLSEIRNKPMFGTPTTLPSMAELMPTTIPMGVAAPKTVAATQATTSAVASAKPQAATTSAPTSQPR